MTLGNYQNHDKISAIRYEHPALSKDNPIILKPKGLWTPKLDASNIAYSSLFSAFDVNQYLYPRPPIDMGWMDISRLKDVKANVLRMPLKFPKSSTWMTPGDEYRIPQELKEVVPLIERVAEYEKFINPMHDYYFCHITFDLSVVNPNEYHRFPGFHGDGIQGTKLTPKEVIEHSYIVASNPATEYCLQPFFLKHLDEAKHNYFLEFDKQAHDVNVYGSLPDHLYLIDPYMVHRSPKINKAGARLFVRITFASVELQHPKNTLNPLFDESMQTYRERIDIRNNLTRHEFPVPLELYGLSNVQAKLAKE